MPEGSCCCGSIRFVLHGAPTMMARCHCIRCRKVGAEVFVFVQRDAFELVAGEDAIAIYEPEADQRYRRCFCARCGTALGEMAEDAPSFPVPANCFDDPLDLQVRFHEFVDEKPAWQPICDGARQFPAHPVKD